MNQGFVTPLYRQPEPTWQVLQRQYQQPQQISVPVAQVPERPAQANVPALITIASALFYLESKDEGVKALALQVFSFSGAAWISQSTN
jgi:hypothetical protein